MHKGKESGHWVRSYDLLLSNFTSETDSADRSTRTLSFVLQVLTTPTNCTLDKAVRLQNRWQLCLFADCTTKGTYYAATQWVVAKWRAMMLIQFKPKWDFVRVICCVSSKRFISCLFRAKWAEIDLIRLQNEVQINILQWSRRQKATWRTTVVFLFASNSPKCIIARYHTPTMYLVYSS